MSDLGPGDEDRGNPSVAFRHHSLPFAGVRLLQRERQRPPANVTRRTAKPSSRVRFPPTPQTASPSQNQKMTASALSSATVQTTIASAMEPLADSIGIPRVLSALRLSEHAAIVCDRQLRVGGAAGSCTVTHSP